MSRTYGHIVVDEAQDLSPMQLRVLDRRSLNGSMTIVGDIAQATGAWAHDDWDEILQHLPERRPPRRAELTIGYRVPGPIMELAARVLTWPRRASPPPSSIRHDRRPPIVESVDREKLGVGIVDAVRRELDVVGSGNVGVIAPTAGRRGRGRARRWRASSSAGRPARASTARSPSCRCRS